MTGGAGAADNKLGRHIRYGFATLGPVTTAGSQFLLTLLLLHAITPAAFGAFSFQLVASQLSFGLSSALYCAPLPLLLARGGKDEQDTVRRCLFAANLLTTMAAFVIFAAVGWLLQASLAACLLFAGYAAAMLLRWFARAYAYAVGVQWRTVACDVVYGCVVLTGVAAMALTGTVNLAIACAVLLAAAVVSLAPFGVTYLRQQFLTFAVSDLARYGAIWKEHSRWSLIGVLTTEATANAHAYIVTFFSGSTDFARIAASAVLIRPIGVAMNALSEFERPQMARQLAGGAKYAADAQIRFFRLALIGVWGATLAVSALLMMVAPRLIFPARYTRFDIVVGGILWLAITLVRLLRTPESTVLQAVGRFKSLAYASVWSSGISILAVAMFLILRGPLWSILGILLGESIFAYFIWREALRWRRGDNVAVTFSNKAA